MSEEDEISETFALLDGYEPPHSDQLKNVTLFVGLSGCGKSTLVHYITNNPNLVSQSSGNSHDFYIVDGNDKISDSTTKSKTKFPELVTDSESKYIFADCPGFSDTRSCKHEIAAAIFTRALLDKVKTLKIVILTSHHSVRKGIDRTNFTSLLNHMADFLKDVNKYQPSLALVVTKVEPQIRFDLDKPTMVSDAEMIEQIGQFIAEVKDELKIKDQRFEATPQGQLLNIILAQENGQYSKIGILRRPNRPGPLQISNHLLETEKGHIKKLIDSLIYTPVHYDFGWTFSEKCLLFMQQLDRQVERNVCRHLDLVFNQIIQSYRMTIESAGLFLDYRFLIPGIQSDMEKLRSELENLIRAIESGNNQDFHFTDILTWINRDHIFIPETLEESFRLQKKYVDFLINICRDLPSRTEHSGDYKKYYPKMLSFGQRLKELLKHVRTLIMKQITATLMSAVGTGVATGVSVFVFKRIPFL